MSEPKDREPVAQPWNEVTTEPLPRRGPASPPPAPSPDSSSKLDAQTGEAARKVAEVRRSPEVERMLEGLGYARPTPPVERAETDGDKSAAHSAGPRAVPVAILTPEPQPAIALSHSLVEEIRSPTPEPVRAAPREVVTARVNQRHAVTVVVRSRVKVSHAAVLGLAVAACMGIAAVGVKFFMATPRVTLVAPSGAAPVPSAPPQARTEGDIPPPPPSPVAVTPTFLPTAMPMPSAVVAVSPMPSASAARRSGAPRSPAPRAPRPAPSVTVAPAIHDDIEVEK